MMMKSLFLAAAAIFAAGHAAAQTAQEPTPAPEVSIPFASKDGIQQWKADGTKGVYIQGSGGWYYARTMGDCPRLPTAITIAFETSAADQLDKYGAIHAEGWRCQLQSVTRTDPPAQRKKAG